MAWSEIRFQLDRIGTVLSVIWVGCMLAFVWWWYPWATSLVVAALLATWAIGYWRINREEWATARAARRHPDALDIARRATGQHLHDLTSRMHASVPYDGREHDFTPWLPIRDRFIASAILPALTSQARTEAADADAPLRRALARVVDDLVTRAFWQSPTPGH